MNEDNNPNAGNGNPPTEFPHMPVEDPAPPPPIATDEVPSNDPSFSTPEVEDVDPEQFPRHVQELKAIMDSIRDSNSRLQSQFNDRSVQAIETAIFNLNERARTRKARGVLGKKIP